MNFNELRTPCFILDADTLRHLYRSFRDALQNHFAGARVAYSVKTNSNPTLLQILKEEGAAAEVVSDTEYDLATALGFKEIVFNGPVKGKEHFLKALQDGQVVNIDSKREMDWLEELPANAQASVGLRVNVPLPEDDTFSRFGFGMEELKEAVERIQALPNVRLAGLHLHRTSKSRSLEVYAHIADKAAAVLQAYNLEPDYIDIGGGFFGAMPGKPSFEDYAAVLARELKAFPGARILVEPGNALCAGAFSFLSSVLDVKKLESETVVVCDGSRNDIDPFFRKTDYFKSFPTVEAGRPTLPSQTVVGGTCLENDRLFHLENAPALKAGDRIAFANTGAYTMALSPLFIRYFPRVYVLENGDYRLASNEWNAQDYLNAYGV